MAILYIRNVPDELERRLRELAALDRRSVTSEALVLLERAVWISEREREGAEI